MPLESNYHSVSRTNSIPSKQTNPFSLLRNLVARPRKDRIAIRPKEKKRRKGGGEGKRERDKRSSIPSHPSSHLSSRFGSSTTRFGSHFVLVTSPNLAATFSCLLLPPPRRRIMKIRRRRAEPSRIIVAVFLRRIISAAIHRPRGGLKREGGKEGRRKRGKRPIVIEARSANARTQFSTPVNS